MASDHENHTKKGGWITTIPFLAGSVVGLGMAMSATSSNLIVYLVHKYNVKAIHAAQISNVVRGCMQLAPVLAAALSDAFFGPYPIAVAGLIFSLLSFVLFTLTAALPSLLPPPCQRGAGGGGATATSCEPPNAAQSAVLYTALCLLAAGNGGTRYNMAALGADQFAGEGQPRRRRQGGGFFSCYFAFLYASYATGDTVLVYVQDGVSWALGFGVCVATTGLALAALLLGSRHYRRPVPKGSPFTAMARVAVAAARKATVDLGSRVQYYHGCNRDDAVPRADQAPSDRFRFLNRAAMVVAGETREEDGSVAKPWRLCTVQQVEDVKSVVRVLPLWSSGILVSVTVNAQVSLTVLQALTMDRAVGPRFAVPAASITVTVLAAFVLAAALFDRVAAPLCAAAGKLAITPLRRVGLGHALNVASMAVAALVERRRIGAARGRAAAAAAVVPMSVLWLVPQLALTGAEEALHLPGNTALFYGELPASLRGTATAMPPLFIAAGSYLSAAAVDAVRRGTTWLPDDLNASRLDCVYWTLAVLAAVNLGYFLLCATTYKYNNYGGDDGNVKAQTQTDDVS
ncbi:protein NRT1/ PTR FAMILY 2.3-like [Oryza glaberrima]|uniref:protein NRT1/ PTR FAMILY 2.3-like n=1 Tax=Oryza glaberrima TaxID=4538 RepID=UPI00224C1957|nr:protein NRT1/ PTR FAMILY 2.3-like [Oryza glaberrima]